MGLVLEVRKLLDCMNCSTLFSYCSVGRVTSEFPLSARVNMALLPLGAARNKPPLPAKRNTFKENVRQQASARLQRHTCRKQHPPPLPQIELLSSLYSCISYYYLYLLCFIVFYLTPVLIRFVKLCVCRDLYTTRARMHIASP